MSKPTVVTSIEVALISTWKTFWSAGLPPNYDEYVEENVKIEKMDLLYSDKLVMALSRSNSQSSASPVSDLFAPVGQTHSSSTLSFTSVTNILLKHLKSHGVPASQAGQELPAGLSQ
jgi:hypothetical protein